MPRRVRGRIHPSRVVTSGALDVRNLLARWTWCCANLGVQPRELPGDRIHRLALQSIPNYYTIHHAMLASLLEPR